MVFETTVSMPEEAAREPETPFAGERLLTAADVGVYLRMPAKKVYELPIPRVELSVRRVRWLESDVLAYIRRHRTGA